MTSFRASAFTLPFGISSAALVGSGVAAPENGTRHGERITPMAERCPVQHARVKRHGHVVTEKKTVCAPVAPSQRDR